MDTQLQINDIADKSGFSEYGYLSVGSLNFYSEVRSLCESNSCRNYATSWACPPAVGTIDECRARVEHYDNALLFSKVYQVSDSFDFEGMQKGLRNFKHIVDDFAQRLQGVLSDYLLLSNEGCGRCTRCTYPDAPCRFPNLLHHSIEGYGFIVSELAKAAGIKYNNGPNTITYFGALIF